ncbi:MAG TPA: alpha/beta fold hydrolase [Acidimicrobiales bacterium]|nr:alpha/beta fold hydrolase [Acidimicrobiales bacterium]
MTAAVVLVHGFASSFDREWVQPGWVALLEDMGRSVIGIDLLGHGQAAKPHDPSAYDAVEDDVVATLPADGPVDAIGFSMGARVLLTLASRTPERFGRIVVGGVGGRLLDGQDDGQGQAIADGVDGKESDDPLAQAFGRFARTPGNDPEALAAFIRRRHVQLTADDLGRITAPVLVVAGDRDPLAGDPAALAAVLPKGEAKLLRKVDHLATASDFGFIDAALSFLG